MKILVYWKKEQQENPNFLEDLILPIQTHSSNIVEIKTGKEDLNNCDGIFTKRTNHFKLWIKTADCAAIVFYDDKHYGILHAGWRWYVWNIIEKMLKKFHSPYVYVAPFLHKFEIQKDFCYDIIYNKVKDNFFEFNNWKIIFNFKQALKNILPKNAIFDERNTFEDENLYSWRKNKTDKRNYTIVLN